MTDPNTLENAKIVLAAIKEGDVQKCESVLRTGFDVNQMRWWLKREKPWGTWNGKEWIEGFFFFEKPSPLLYIALDLKKVDIIKLLLKYGADPNLESKQFKETCYQKAAKVGIDLKALKTEADEARRAEEKRKAEELKAAEEKRRAEAQSSPSVSAASATYPAAVKAKRVMISYNWSSQEVVKKIHAELVKLGVNVWIDLEGMIGNLIDKMAEAVNESDVVLVCANEGYHYSENCKAEAQYAQKQKKVIIYLKMDNKPLPDGWLDLMVGSNLYVDFSDPARFQASMTELVRQLKLIHVQSNEVPDLKLLSINSGSSSPSPTTSSVITQATQQGKKVVVRRLGKTRGGDVISDVVSLEDLKKRGGELLGIQVAKVRVVMESTEVAVYDVRNIEDGKIVYLTTEEEEQEF